MWNVNTIIYIYEWNTITKQVLEAEAGDWNVHDFKQQGQTKAGAIPLT